MHSALTSAETGQHLDIIAAARSNQSFRRVVGTGEHQCGRQARQALRQAGHGVGVFGVHGAAQPWAAAACSNVIRRVVGRAVDDPTPSLAPRGRSPACSCHSCSLTTLWVVHSAGRPQVRGVPVRP